MRLFLPLTLLMAFGVTGSTQTVRMVKDIHPAGHGTPAFALPVGQRVLLSAQDGVHGRELWVTDGTEEGTRLLYDIHPDNPDGNAFISPLIVFQDRLYFGADDGVHGRELWVSDGTPEGTAMVVDFNPEGHALITSQNAIEMEGHFYYLAQAYNGYLSLFRSDGTAQGTELLYFDLYLPVRAVPGLRAFNNAIYSFNEIGSEQFLDLRAEIPGMLITGYLMGTIGPLADQQVRFAGHNDSLLFINARTTNFGRELWVTDGTLYSLKILADIHPAGDAIQNGTQVHQVPGTNQVVFAANDGTHGVEPWISDGTTAGTHLLRDIRPDGSFSTLTQQPFQPLGDKLYFAAYSSSGGQSLWVTDGTAPGTAELYDIQPGGNGLPQGVSPAARVNGRLLFAADDGIHGLELWITDGTPDGTRMVKDIHPGGDAQPGTFQEFAGRLWFTADDGVHGRELWVSDGTEEGTYMVEDIHPGGGSSHVTFLLAQPEKDRLYFRADDGTHDFELWVLEGTGVPIATVPSVQPYRPFPNPAAYTLYLDLPERERISVYHITGALAMETELDAGQALDIARLAPGWYFLRGAASGRSGQFVKF
jgi:ELWxxDGT repeat protein